VANRERFLVSSSSPSSQFILPWVCIGILMKSQNLVKNWVGLYGLNFKCKILGIV